MTKRKKELSSWNDKQGDKKISAKSSGPIINRDEENLEKAALMKGHS
jgi:hypothetical protein